MGPKIASYCKNNQDIFERLNGAPRQSVPKFRAMSLLLPKWLDRILPNIDVEGESVMKELESRINRQSDLPDEELVRKKAI